MKCYTGTGDQGETCIFGGKLDKHDNRIDAIGSIDELNASLGAARAFSANEEVRETLDILENDIFSIGAELAAAGSLQAEEKRIEISEAPVEQLEKLIDGIQQKLPQQKKFIIPAGTQAAMMLNVARTVCRRAERALVKLDREEKLNPEILKYANRLSSLLYILMRFENMKEKVKEKNPVYYFVE